MFLRCYFMWFGCKTCSHWYIETSNHIQQLQRNLCLSKNEINTVELFPIYLCVPHAQHVHSILFYVVILFYSLLALLCTLLFSSIQCYSVCFVHFLFYCITQHFCCLHVGLYRILFSSIKLYSIKYHCFGSFLFYCITPLSNYFCSVVLHSILLLLYSIQYYCSVLFKLSFIVLYCIQLYSPALFCSVLVC